MTDKEKPDPKNSGDSKPDPDAAPAPSGKPIEPPTPTDYGHIVIATKIPPKTLMTLTEKDAGGKRDTESNSSKKQAVEKADEKD